MFLSDLVSRLRKKLMSAARGKYGYGVDQRLLGETMWPSLIKYKRTYVHDAFRCG